MKHENLDDDFSSNAKPIGYSSNPKRKAAQYLGKSVDDKLSKNDLRKLQAKANKIKKSEKKAERQSSIQLAKQIDLKNNSGVDDKK